MYFLGLQLRRFFRSKKRAKTSLQLPSAWRRCPTLEPLESRHLLAAFTAGDLAVVQVGDGSAALADTGAAVFINEYTPSGTLVQQIPLPTTATPGGNQALVMGTATNEGELNLSTDGKDLLLVGYNTTVGGGGATIESSTSATINRTVGEISAAGTVNTTTALTDFASANDPRSAAGSDAQGFWLGGADGSAGGVRYIASLGSSTTTSTNLTGTVKNGRDVEIFNGQLYFGSDKTSSIINALGTGLPTTGSPTISGFPGTALTPGANSSTNAFFFAKVGAGADFTLNGTDAGFNTMYVTDADNHSTGSTPGITKYSWNGSSWVVNGTVGDTTVRYTGLIGSVDGSGNVTLFATNVNGLVKLTDSSGFGGTFSASPTTVVPLPSNVAFRGIAFTPTGGGSVSQPPVVTTSSGALSYSKGAGAVAIDPGVTVTDTSVSNLASATVAITGNFQSSEDALAFTNQNGITGSYNTSTGVLTLTGSASVQAYQTALASVTYADSSQSPNTSARTITFTANDGTQNSNAATKTINLTSANSPPTIKAPSVGQSDIENSPLTFSTTNSNGITVADPDGASASEAITLSVGSGSTLQLATTSGLTVTGNNSNSVVMTGPLTALNAALNGLIYTPGTGFTGTDSLQILINDLGNTGTGGPMTATASVSISVVSPNAPIIAPGTGSLSYTEQSGAVVIDPNMTITDPGGNNISSVAISINSGYVSGEDVLGFTAQSGISGSFNTATGTLTLSGAASASAFQAALRTVTYTDTSASPSTATRTVAFVATDAASLVGGQISRTINVILIAPPAVSTPPAQSDSANTLLVFSTSNSNAISVTDPNGATATEQVTLTASNGTLQLATTAGLSNVTGNGTGSVQFTGTLSAVNTALNGLGFQPTAGFSGAASVQVAVEDLGNTKTGSGTVSITVAQQTFSVSGKTLTVLGTAGGDTFNFAFTSATGFQVTLNGTTQVFDTSSVNQVIFYGGIGNDTATVTGSGAAEVAIFAPGALMFGGPNYQLLLNSVENISIAGGAKDVAEMIGSGATNDIFTARPSDSVMQGTGFQNEATGFGLVTALALKGAGTAYLYGSASGHGTLQATSTYDIYNGTGFDERSIGFAASYAFSSTSTDTAYFYGSGGSDTFASYGSYSRMNGTGYYNQANGFTYTVGAGNGGTGTAFFYTDGSDAALFGSGPWASIAYNNFFVNVTGFSHVDAEADATGNHGKRIGAIDFTLATAGNWVNF